MLARRAADAGVVELVDALDSKSSSERSVGSSPTARTTEELGAWGLIRSLKPLEADPLGLRLWNSPVAGS